MSTDRNTLEVGGIEVEVIRKPIKNLHLGVYPPAGRVRVAVPEHINDEAVRLAVATKIGWIRRQQDAFALQERQSKREMVSGETHYFFGRRYRLRVIEEEKPSQVRIQGTTHLILRVRPDTSSENKAEILARWYRRELRSRISERLPYWEQVVGVKVAEWGIRRMKTRWGSCNIEKRRVWFNLELAKKPFECLDYIIAHELVHLIERHHNDHFRELMDRVLPQWRLYRDKLNRAPLAHEKWTY